MEKQWINSGSSYEEQIGGVDNRLS